MPKPDAIPETGDAEAHHGRFTVLLGALLVLLVVPPLLPGVFIGRQVIVVIFTVVAIGAAFNVTHRRATLLFIALMATGTLAAQGAAHLWPESRASQIVALLFAGGLYLLGLLGVARGVFRSRRVTPETIRGAICLYILLGVIWATLFAVVETARPGSFSRPESVQESVQAAGRPRAEATGFFYYSFVTLTTLGYGDITPRTELARTLSWFEAVMGQLFIAVTLAQLVALRVSQNLLEGD